MLALELPMDDRINSPMRHSEAHFLIDDYSEPSGDQDVELASSAILVLDYRTLTGDMDPVATLTRLAAETWEEVLLHHPEAVGPAN